MRLFNPLDQVRLQRRQMLFIVLTKSNPTSLVMFVLLNFFEAIVVVVLVLAAKVILDGRYFVWTPRLKNV